MTLGMVYCRIIQALHRAGFHRHQYSDYCHPHTAALHTYLTMVNLRLELAPSKLATILKSIKIHHIPDIATMDQTHELLLGGHYSQHLYGLTPRDLVEDAGIP